MPFPFRRRDPRREELERLRQSITEMRNEVGLLEASAHDEDAEQTAGRSIDSDADIYMSVSRLRVTMVRRELTIKQRELQEMISREAELAQTLKMRPMRDEPPAAATPAPAVGTATTTAAPAVVPATAVPATTTAAPDIVLATAAPAPTASDDAMPGPAPTVGANGARDAQPVAKAAAVGRPSRGTTGRSAGRKAVNVGLALVAIVLVSAIGLLFSGLLDIDPSRDYGFLSTVGRELQGMLGASLRAGSL